MKKVHLHLNTNPAGGCSLAAGFKKFVLPGLFILAVILFFAPDLLAQNASEFGSMITNLKASERSASAVKAAHIESLVNEVQSTVYAVGGKVRTVGTTPAVRLETDISSLKNLKDMNTSVSQVELITIRLSSANDLNNNLLDFSTLTGFTNLKYVLYLCEFDCTAKAINNLYQPDPHRSIDVIYLVSIPN